MTTPNTLVGEARAAFLSGILQVLCSLRVARRAIEAIEPTRKSFKNHNEFWIAINTHRDRVRRIDMLINEYEEMSKEAIHR